MSKKWELLKNYLTYRVTTAVSEGINHVIKSMKRMHFDFRTIRYFQLKFLQRCGLVNSRYMTDSGGATIHSKKLLGYDDFECFHQFALL